MFQFQYGAIKSLHVFEPYAASPEFQFQYGAIKSIWLSGRRRRRSMFQFQYGAIKREKVISLHCT